MFLKRYMKKGIFFQYNASSFFPLTQLFETRKINCLSFPPPFFFEILNKRFKFFFAKTNTDISGFLFSKWFASWRGSKGQDRSPTTISRIVICTSNKAAVARSVCAGRMDLLLARPKVPRSFSHLLRNLLRDLLRGVPNLLWNLPNLLWNFSNLWNLLNPHRSLLRSHLQTFPFPHS